VIRVDKNVRVSHEAAIAVELVNVGSLWRSAGPVDRARSNRDGM